MLLIFIFYLFYSSISRFFRHFLRVTGFAHPVVVEFVVKTNFMETVNRMMLFSVVTNVNINVSFISVYGTSIYECAFAYMDMLI